MISFRAPLHVPLLAATLLVFCMPLALKAEVKLDPGFQAADLSRGLGFLPADRVPSDAELLALPADSFKIRQADSPLSLGYTNKVLLVRVLINNQSGRTDFRMITGLARHGYTRLVYARPQGSDSPGSSDLGRAYFSAVARTTGADLPFYHRPLVSNRPALLVYLPPGLSEIRLALRSRDSLSAAITLAVPEAFRLEQDFEHLWYGALFAALLIIGCYNFLIYLSVRDRGHLYYTILTLFAAFYFVVISGYSRRLLWPDSVEFDLLMGFVSVAGYIAAIVLFGRTFLGTKERLPLLDWPLLILQYAGLIVGLSAIWFSFGLVARILAMMAILVIALICTSAVVLCLRRVREAYFFLAAFLLFAAGTLAYALRVAGVVPLNFFSVHGVQIGSVAELLLLSFALADRVRVLQDEVRARMLELEFTHRQLATSEKRYRHLVEGSTDIIFVLDSEFAFESINGSVSEILGLAPKQLRGQHFRSILYEPTEARSFVSVLVEERLRALEQGGRVQFSAEWRTRRAEPRRMKVDLERIMLDDGPVFFGRAAPGDEDALLPFLVAERSKYVITNYFGIGELLGDRLTRNLQRYMSHDDALNLRLGVREILVNAIEHGNLGITYQEKTEALLGGKYFEFLQERQADPQYSGRTVRVEYSLSPQRVWFRVTDEGEGFDHRSMSARSMEELNRSASVHGRGMLLTRNYFDVMRYNDKGNEVLLVKTVSPQNRARQLSNSTT